MATGTIGSGGTGATGAGAGVAGGATVGGSAVVDGLAATPVSGDATVVDGLGATVVSGDATVVDGLGATVVSGDAIAGTVGAAVGCGTAGSGGIGSHTRETDVADDAATNTKHTTRRSADAATAALVRAAEARRIKRDRPRMLDTGSRPSQEDPALPGRSLSGKAFQDQRADLTEPTRSEAWGPGDSGPHGSLLQPRHRGASTTHSLWSRA